MLNRILPTRRLLAAAALPIALLASCGDVQGPAGTQSVVRLPFLAAFSSHGNIAQVVVTVSGSRIDPALVFNFPVVNDTARGTMELPVGTNRTLLGQAFDSLGTEVLRGQRTVDVAAGANAAVILVLSPLTGSVPVTAAIGNVTLTLTPSATSLRAGGTLTLSTEVRDGSGEVANVPVRYAVSRPPAARVRDDGLLTALDTGNVIVTATAFGRSASATLTFTAGTVLEGLTMLPDSVIGSGSVDALIGIRDNVGVDSVRVRTVSPTGAAGPSCSAVAPLFGTRTLGEFSCALVVPSGAASGRWPVSSVELHSGANVAVLDSVSLRHRGAAAAVRNVP